MPRHVDVCDDMHLVKVYRTLGRRLRHSLSPVCRWIGQHCDTLAAKILEPHKSSLRIDPNEISALLSQMQAQQANKLPDPPVQSSAPTDTSSFLQDSQDGHDDAEDSDGSSGDEEEEEDDDEISDTQSNDSEPDSLENSTDSASSPSPSSESLPTLSRPASIISPKRLMEMVACVSNAPSGIDIALPYVVSLLVDLPQMLDDGRLQEAAKTCTQVLQVMSATQVTITPGSDDIRRTR